ncbi:MAG: ABC-2 family transporter protein [Planctomycetes bacterium ADurb.Bin401]|nr:MAG: ABC-2 family transporter protein [Planctomycetes bacterium ADurb.Bin401]
MRTLIWKEWREQRLFFFLAVGFVIFYGIVLSIWPQVVGVKKGVPELIAIIILPLIFSVGIPTTSFTSDFTKKTLDFQLSNPVSSARIFWIKFLFNLALLFALILLAKLFLRISIDDYARYFWGPHDLSKKPLVIAIFFISILIIYSATCFSSLLLKNTLPAIICTPFILLFGILLVLPLIIVLFLISPYLAIFNFLLFSCHRAGYTTPTLGTHSAPVAGTHSAPPSGRHSAPVVGTHAAPPAGT